MARFALLASLLTGSSAAATEGAEPAARSLEVATLGGGCFWCLEAVYEDVKGVARVISGYAGGHKAAPSYRQVVSGRTGHAEVVQVHYDPTVVSYETLLEVLWTIHDPTSLNRQGADVGTQYRSIILWHDEAQQAAAQASIQAVQARHGGKDVVTEVVPLETFYEAEAYHQDYFANNPDKPYCAFVVSPKLDTFRKVHSELRK